MEILALAYGNLRQTFAKLPCGSSRYFAISMHSVQTSYNLSRCFLRPRQRNLASAGCGVLTHHVRCASARYHFRGELAP